MSDVYKNLHTGTYSVRTDGRVVAHPTEVLLTEPRFVVQPAGRERVLRERRKNVHAFVRGTVEFVSEAAVAVARLIDGWRHASYNPYRAGFFYDKETGEPVTEAKVAVLTDDGIRYLP
ncbi:MAG: hypothetical protein ACOYOQ_00520 [Microthrixaceae bacterium]